MEKAKEKTITVETTINTPVDKTWSYWIEPKHITQWYFASDDWYAPHAENKNSYEMQKGGWQSILNNFKKYCESK
jgi:uncharacterized protein YndB with AHSA1/START domain